MEWLPIGQVADRTGVAVSALRYDEPERLLRSERNAGGQRRYRRDVLRRVAFVKIAQHVGLTLDEIRRSLAGPPDDRTPTQADWARLSASWRPVLNQHIATLVRRRAALDSRIGCGCLSLKSWGLCNPGDTAVSLGQGARYLINDDRPG
jgi:MerR family redox-sensitive transcriptional activator SoxR